MASVQDIETRIIGIENMMRFVLANIKIQDTSNPFSQPKSLLELYYQAISTPAPVEPTPLVKET